MLLRLGEHLYQDQKDFDMEILKELLVLRKLHTFHQVISPLKAEVFGKFPIAISTAAEIQHLLAINSKLFSGMKREINWSSVKTNTLTWKNKRFLKFSFSAGARRPGFTEFNSDTIRHWFCENWHNWGEYFGVNKNLNTEIRSNSQFSIKLRILTKIFANSFQNTLTENHLRLKKKRLRNVGTFKVKSRKFGRCYNSKKLLYQEKMVFSS